MRQLKPLTLQIFSDLLDAGVGDLLDPRAYLDAIQDPARRVKIAAALAVGSDDPEPDLRAENPNDLRARLLDRLFLFFPDPAPKKEDGEEPPKAPEKKNAFRLSTADKWRERALELAALAGVSDPRPFSIRQLERAARAKRREEWDRIAFLRLDLRRLLQKDPPKFYCDLNPVLSEEERRAIRKTLRQNARKNLPEASPAEVIAALCGR